MASTGLGASPWAVLAIVLLSFAVRCRRPRGPRAVRARRPVRQRPRHAGNGRRPSPPSALLADRLMLGALAAVVAGHYLVAFGRSVAGVTSPSLVGDSGPMTFALAAIGDRLVDAAPGTVTKRADGGAGDRRLRRRAALPGGFRDDLGRCSRRRSLGPLQHLASPRPLALAAAFGLRLVGDRQRRIAGPGCPGSRAARIRNLQRVVRLVGAYGVVITAGLAFLFALTVRDQDIWGHAPLRGRRVSAGGSGLAASGPAVAGGRGSRRLPGGDDPFQRPGALTACWRGWWTKGSSTNGGGPCITNSAHRGAASTRSPSPRSPSCWSPAARRHGLRAATRSRSSSRRSSSWRPSSGTAGFAPNLAPTGCRATSASAGASGRSA